MKVRTYNSQAPIPTGTGAALITNIEGMTNTGESQIWNAASGLGEVVMQLGQKKMAFDDVMATSESAKILKTAELNFQSKVEKDGNTDNYYKYIEEYQKEVNDGNSKLKWGSPAGRTRAMADISAQAEIFSKQAEVGIIKQKSRDALAVSSSQAIEAIRSDDGTTGGALAAKSALDNLEKALSTVFSPERVEVEMRKIVLKGKEEQEKLIREQIQTAALSDLQNTAIKSGWEESLKKINDPAFQKQYNLNSDDIGELSTRISQQKNITDETAKLEVEKQNTEIGDAILNGDITVLDKIKNSSLSYDQKKKWTEEVKSLSGRDDGIYNDLLTKISQEPDKYDSTYLASFITKGINGEDYKELNTILTSAKTKDSYQKVIHNQYTNAINDMQTRKLFNSGTSEQDKLDNINKATRSMIALENWAKKNPNATSDQYQAFFKTLTIPNISSYGVRISEDERQEIIANTGIDLYDGIDLFGLVSGEEGVKAQAEIDKKREALLNENVLPTTNKRKDGESIDDYIKRTTPK